MIGKDLLVIAGLGLALSGPHSVCQSPERPSLRAADIECFRWFDTLGFPDFKKCKCVKVYSEGRREIAGKKQQDTCVLAFLVKDEGTRFTVLTPSLTIATYSKAVQGAQGEKTFRYEEADLKDEATNQLKQFGGPRARLGCVFVWARACAAQGHVELARILLDEAREWPYSPDVFAPNSAYHVAWRHFRRQLEAFGNAAISRQELLIGFAFIAKNFPDIDAGYNARHYVALLEKMVAEDREHYKKPVVPAKKTTKKVRVGDLIFQLRDQNALIATNPGGSFLLSDPRGEKSPADQLVKIGYDAFLQLIGAWDDNRFTRTVTYDRLWCANGVLRVGSGARIILESIAGRSFADKKSAEAWWVAFQRKGEKQTWIEATEAGDDHSPGLADRLAAKYPTDAVDALIKGTRQAKHSGNRWQLVQIASGLKGEKLERFLREELKGPSRAARAVAAEGLLAHGIEEGVPAMIQEWASILKKDTDSDDNWKLIDFLAWCGKPEAIQALAKDLRKRPVQLRREVILSLEAPSWTRREEGPRPMSKDVLRAVDDLLVAALDDREQDDSYSFSNNGMIFSQPRMCDLSGYLLANRWGRPERFDRSVSVETRDRQIEAMKQAWREKRGR